jgi:hypothetical protein
MADSPDDTSDDFLRDTREMIERLAGDPECPESAMKSTLFQALTVYSDLEGIDLSQAFVIAITQGNVRPLRAMCDFVLEHEILIDFKAVVDGCHAEGKPLIDYTPGTQRPESKRPFLDLFVKACAGRVATEALGISEPVKRAEPRIDPDLRGRHHRQPPDTGPAR